MVVVQRDEIGGGKHIRRGVAHRNADTGQLYHRKVVAAVAAGHDLGGRKPQVIGQRKQPAPLVHARRVEFQVVRDAGSRLNAGAGRHNRGPGRIPRGGVRVQDGKLLNLAGALRNQRVKVVGHAAARLDVGQQGGRAAGQRRSRAGRVRVTIPADKQPDGAAKRLHGRKRPARKVCLKRQPHQRPAAGQFHHACAVGSQRKPHAGHLHKRIRHAGCVAACGGQHINAAVKRRSDRGQRARADALFIVKNRAVQVQGNQADIRHRGDLLVGGILASYTRSIARFSSFCKETLPRQGQKAPAPVGVCSQGCGGFLQQGCGGYAWVAAGSFFAWK